MPAISVIIPAYNTEKHLRECLDSVLAQTFTDFEVILIDDGSTDGSPVICDAYATSYPDRIRVYHQNNSGVSAARNKGIDVSDGEYVLFCDSDDTVDPCWCGMLYEAAQALPDSLICCDMRRFDEAGNQRCAFTSADFISPGGAEYADTDLSVCTYYALYKVGLSGFVSNKIYRRSILDRERIRFEESVNIAEDVLFNTVYIPYCHDIRILHTPLYTHHFSQESLSHKRRTDSALLHLMPFSVRIPLLDKEDIGTYCDSWLYSLLHLLEDDILNRSEDSALERRRYARRVFESEEMRYCIDHATGSRESELFMKVLRLHRYGIYRAFENIVHFKNRERD